MTIDRFRGDTKPLIVSLKASDRSPFDITGCSFIWTVIDQAKKGTTDYKFQVNGQIVGDPKNGRVSFSPSAQQVNLIGSFIFDIQMTDASGSISTIAYGAISFKQDVTI